MTGDGLKDLMTPEELCCLLKVKKQRVYEWVHLSRIPYINAGRFLRFSSSQINEWLESIAFGIIDDDEPRIG